MDKYDHIYIKTIRQNIPLNADIELTYKCNLKCLHCYHIKESHGLPEMTFSQVTSVLDQLAEMGCLFITFTGGEVFLREDIFDVFEYARGKEFAFRVLTNGTLLDDEKISRLTGLNPLSVEISLYSIDAMIHEKMTGVKGSYEKTIYAIKKLRKNNITVKIKGPVTDMNFAGFIKLKEEAARMGCSTVFYPSVAPRLDRSRDTLSLNVSVGRLRELYKLSRDNINKVAQDRKRNGHEPLCTAGLNTMHISPDGDVYPCLMLRHKCGNISSEPVAEIWNSDGFKKIRKTTVSDLKYCSDCGISVYCNRCSGLAELETGDWLGKSERMCALAEICRELAEEKEPV